MALHSSSDFWTDPDAAMATTRLPRKLRSVKGEDPTANSVSETEREIGLSAKNLSWVLLKEARLAVVKGDRSGEMSFERAGLLRELERTILLERICERL